MRSTLLDCRSLRCLSLLLLIAVPLGCGGAGGTAPTAVAPGPAEIATDLGVQIPDDWQLPGQLPMDYVRGSLSVDDLDRALSAGDPAAHDILWLLYWVDQVDESALLSVLQAHGYGGADGGDPVASLVNRTAAYTADAGTEDPPSGGHDERTSSMHQQYFSSQQGTGHDAEVSRNHDLNISRTWDHQLTVSRQNHDYEISKKFGFGHKEDVSKDYQQHEKDVSKFTHDTKRSNAWPSNHFAEVSHDHPPGDEEHHVADSRIWPPNHTFFFSRSWEPPTHTASVSRGYPPNHAPGSSRNGNVNHDWRLSVQYPQPHTADVSRSHALPISRSWPNFPAKHSVAASRTRPPNHFEAVSFSWPPSHIAVTSSNWPPNHFEAVSKSWDENDPAPHTSWWSRVVPKGHTWFKSAKDTGEVVKDIKDVVGKKKSDAGTPKEEQP